MVFVVVVDFVGIGFEVDVEFFCFGCCVFFYFDEEGVCVGFGDKVGGCIGGYGWSVEGNVECKCIDGSRNCKFFYIVFFENKFVLW